MARAQSESVAADATYDNGEFLQWLVERGITPYMKIGGGPAVPLSMFDRPVGSVVAARVVDQNHARNSQATKDVQVHEVYREWVVGIAGDWLLSRNALLCGGHS